MGELIRFAKQYIALIPCKIRLLRFSQRLHGIAKKFLAKGVVSIEYQLFTAIFHRMIKKTN
ncbi:MAG: hypothetical protein DCF19_03635 [Pseudanabaena frigida]|uniref:Uncharacterized protein n=1 Tax=Pseudanabaena frigida TaxID=945775 RepID=A0A2W4WF59_9CYAN|nr:MAG: hypothetical protein DCF19_03635 [Pseudanabaena frigida]